MRNLATIALAACLGTSALAAEKEKYKIIGPSEYTGLCDASGAVPIGTNLFLVATDEDNILRLYRSDASGGPLQEWNFNGFLGVAGKSLEADLEGAALVGNRAFWIGSHGLNASGKERFNRRRFFATDISVNGLSVSLTPVGSPCVTLMDELERDPRYASFRLDKARLLPPKAQGALDIEGLGSMPDGSLLIGFRNPIPGGKALLAPLLNPSAVVEGKAAQFGAPVRIDLGGLGIRDIARHGTSYLIAAGPYASGHSRLYRWEGPGTAPVAISVNHLGRYNPEAVIVYPAKGLAEVLILSDDGKRNEGGVPCKELTNPASRKFRAFWVEARERD